MNTERALRVHCERSPFTSERLEVFRALLVARREELARTFNGLSEAARSTAGDAVGGISSVPAHNAELASETFEQELSISLMGRTHEELDEIQAALERIDSCAYGLCADCDLPIPPARLEAIPMAKLCVGCQASLERL